MKSLFHLKSDTLCASCPLLVSRHSCSLPFQERCWQCIHKGLNMMRKHGALSCDLHSRVCVLAHCFETLATDCHRSYTFYFDSYRGSPVGLDTNPWAHAPAHDQNSICRSEEELLRRENVPESWLPDGTTSTDVKISI